MNGELSPRSDEESLTREITFREKLEEWVRAGQFEGLNQNQIHSFATMVSKVIREGKLRDKSPAEHVYYCRIGGSGSINATPSIVVQNNQDVSMLVEHPETKENLVFDPFTGIAAAGPQDGFIVPDSNYLS